MCCEIICHLHDCLFFCRCQIVTVILLLVLRLLNKTSNKESYNCLTLQASRLLSHALIHLLRFVDLNRFSSSLRSKTPYHPDQGENSSCMPIQSRFFEAFGNLPLCAAAWVGEVVWARTGMRVCACV